MKKLMFALLILCVSGSIIAQENVKVKSKDRTSKKFSKKGLISLNVLTDEVEMELGKKGYVGISVHSSVGTTGSVSSSDEEMKLLETKFVYKNKSKSYMTGGDAGTKYFIYEPTKKGTYSIVIIKEFRGDVTSERTIKVIVK